MFTLVRQSICHILGCSRHSCRYSFYRDTQGSFLHSFGAKQFCSHLLGSPAHLPHTWMLLSQLPYSFYRDTQGSISCTLSELNSFVHTCSVDSPTCRICYSIVQKQSPLQGGVVCGTAGEGGLERYKKIGKPSTALLFKGWGSTPLRPL